MCGRLVQASEPLRYAFVDGLSVPYSRTRRPSYIAPSQELYVIRHNHKTGERTLDLLRWGLIPHGYKDPNGGRKPINARAESVASLPTFRAAYAKRRCIVPVESFFEWRAIKGARAKQPYAVAMKDRTPFAIAGPWENWRHPQSGEWTRTFASSLCLRMFSSGKSMTVCRSSSPNRLTSAGSTGNPTRTICLCHSRRNGDVAGLDAGE
jgi:putative SOS response-associated peptidase YedK